MLIYIYIYIYVYSYYNILSLIILMFSLTRLEGISKASTCGIHALPVQMPFHLYEDDVYSLMERSGQF